MSKKLNLRELLNFFDCKVSSSIGHASAINGVIGEDLGVALLLKYFSDQKLNALALSEPCTQKTKKGKRLDKWIVIEDTDSKIIYQVEIKNWNAHSLNSETVQDHADENYMSEYRLRRWKKRFDSDRRKPRQTESQKVLLPMKVPTTYRDYDHRTLLCFWEALHVEGKSDAMFEVSVNSDYFENKMTVFSMSNFVSESLKQSDALEIHLSDVEARIDWLNKMYS
jgi:hypothetical protein